MKQSVRTNKKAMLVITIIVSYLLMMWSPIIPMASTETESINADGGNPHPFSDIAGEACEEAVSVLNAIGILEGKSETEFDPNGKVTRAEMSAIVLRLVGLSNNKGYDMPFSDVSKTHWAYGDISTAYAMKIVNGFDDNTFVPDGSVTLPQAVKMLIVLLGYGEHAEANGGYPGGYLVKASQLGLLKGLPDSNDDALSRASVAILVYNATDTEITVKANFGGDNIKFITVEDATLLSEYLHIQKYENIITANYFTVISAPRSLRQGEIALDDKVFDVGTTNAAELIGRKVTLYVKEDANSINDGKILYVKAKKNVKILTVDFRDIAPTTTKSRLVYNDDNNGQAYANISDAIMIYNGTLKPIWDEKDLFKDVGKLTLISNTGDSYTIILAYEYKNYAVEGIDADNMTLRLMKNKDGINEISVDTSGTSVKKNIKDADGNTITINDFQKWDVISIAKSADERVMEITRSRNAVTGKITELGDKEAVIDHTKYTISRIFENMDDLKLGMQATYYMDCFGELAFVNEAEKSYKYGYIVSASLTGKIDSRLRIKIFTEDNTMMVYNTMDKVYINGVLIDKDDILSTDASRNNVVKNETEKLFDLNGVKGQMIRYELTDSGEINSIETAIDNSSLGSYTTEFSMDFNKSGNTMFYGRDISSFDCRNIITADTKIFVTPAEYTGVDEDYGMMRNTSLVHGVNRFSRVSVFDVTEDNVVSAVWIESGAGASADMDIRTDSTAAVLLDIVKGINDNGDVVTKLKVFTEEGVEQTFYAEDDVDVYFGLHALTDLATESQVEITDNTRTPKEKINVLSLNCGDIIQFSATNTKVTCINVMFRAETPAEGEKGYGSYGENSTEGYVEAEKNSFYTSRTYGYGTVKSVATSTLVAEFPSPNGKEMFDRAYLLRGQVLRYNQKNHTIEKIGATQICVGDKVFVSRITYSQKLIVIYS